MMYALTSLDANAQLDNYPAGSTKPVKLPVGTTITCSEAEYIALERNGRIDGPLGVAPVWFSAAPIGG